SCPEQCAIPGWRKKGTDPRTGCSNAFGQVSLGNHFEFDFSIEIELIKNVGVHLAWKGAHNFAHPSGLEKRSQTNLTVPGIIADDHKIFRSLFEQSVYELYWLSRSTKATDHDGRTIVNIG